ncbi:MULTISPECIES: hypothetical protein [Pedobacter]|uniref:hypothetical protein n=1 Tax=Pedobacter TaxID=84567 RepID=UPI00210C5D7A|nr:MULTISPECIES: hypothetical protein [unclassified Pedobacter]
MQEFDHIQSLWQSHSVETNISSDEMLAQAKKEVSAIKTRSLLNIIGMLVSFAAFLSLFLFFSFDSWTTQAGLAIIAMLTGVYTFILYLDYRIISRTDFTADPASFLASLKAYQLNKFTLYNKLYWVYLVGLCLGFGLYAYDMLNHFSILWQALIIGFIVLWVSLSATILRKAYLNREKERLDQLMDLIKKSPGETE